MKIACPYCGYDRRCPPRQRNNDEPFLYLEDIVCYRRVLLDKCDAYALAIHGYYQTGEGFDDGDNPRLLCGDCLEEFPLPTGVEGEFE